MKQLEWYRILHWYGNSLLAALWVKHQMTKRINHEGQTAHPVTMSQKADLAHLFFVNIWVLRTPIKENIPSLHVGFDKTSVNDVFSSIMLIDRQNRGILRSNSELFVQFSCIIMNASAESTSYLLRGGLRLVGHDVLSAAGNWHHRGPNWLSFLPPVVAYWEMWAQGYHGTLWGENSIPPWEDDRPSNVAPPTKSHHHWYHRFPFVVVLKMDDVCVQPESSIQVPIVHFYWGCWKTQRKLLQTRVEQCLDAKNSAVLSLLDGQ